MGQIDKKGEKKRTFEDFSYLAARQLSQVRLQLLPDHSVDGHQAEDAGLPHAALSVVVALKCKGRKSPTSTNSLSQPAV